ncbi:Arm DNA-binding domain-containing protein [Ancylobacter sp. SL191]|uniref:Arm DNA-binding domain-containing protein n=1 Tax=Ancylobacter sp. SL191 TaxID=2995166 RepID=UPI002271F879|nr:Arm DNA-binding domain-containing protein [Ancylobacter sp. SL191]WAC28065.1 Arm DNA-binding domain-containing protein [Ancylobacter sp. SL191]
MIKFYIYQYIVKISRVLSWHHLTVRDGPETTEKPLKPKGFGGFFVWDSPTRSVGIQRFFGIGEANKWPSRTRPAKTPWPRTQQKRSDSGGLHLFVSPSGGRLWRMAYRFDGKQKQRSFGAYPAVSLKDAVASFG